MTDLEFIEKEIRELKFQINYIKSNMKKYIDFRTEGQLEIDTKQLKLNRLQQIKSKLEAWEVVEEEIEYNKEKVCSERPDIVYSFEHWTFEINEDQSDFEEKSTKLKKALEVRE